MWYFDFDPVTPSGFDPSDDAKNAVRDASIEYEGWSFVARTQDLASLLANTPVITITSFEQDFSGSGMIVVDTHGSTNSVALEYYNTAQAAQTARTNYANLYNISQGASGYPLAETTTGLASHPHGTVHMVMLLHSTGNSNTGAQRRLQGSNDAYGLIFSAWCFGNAGREFWNQETGTWFGYTGLCNTSTVDVAYKTAFKRLRCREFPEVPPTARGAAYGVEGKPGGNDDLTAHLLVGTDTAPTGDQFCVNLSGPLCNAGCDWAYTQNACYNTAAQFSRTGAFGNVVYGVVRHRRSRALRIVGLTSPHEYPPDAPTLRNIRLQAEHGNFAYIESGIAAYPYYAFVEEDRNGHTTWSNAFSSTSPPADWADIQNYNAIDHSPKLPHEGRIGDTREIWVQPNGDMLYEQSRQKAGTAPSTLTSCWPDPHPLPGADVGIYGTNADALAEEATTLGELGFGYRVCRVPRGLIIPSQGFETAVRWQLA